MKRRRGYRTMTGLERAEQRVDGLLLRIARIGAPLWAGSRARDQRQLRSLRRLARDRAVESGRIDLLEDAQERVSRSYVERLGDAGLWTGLFAVSVPFSGQERADSQAVLRDLVAAAVVEDLLPPMDVAALREDGERLLGSAAGDRSPGDEPSAIEPAADRAPPLEPFTSPYMPAQHHWARVFGIILLASVLVDLALVVAARDAVFIATFATAIILLVALWRAWGSRH